MSKLAKVRVYFPNELFARDAVARMRYRLNRVDRDHDLLLLDVYQVRKVRSRPAIEIWFWPEPEDEEATRQLAWLLACRAQTLAGVTASFIAYDV